MAGVFVRSVDFRSRTHHGSSLIRFLRHLLSVYPTCALFFMMLFVPTSYKVAKGILLAYVLVIIGGSALLRRRLPLHRSVLIWTSIMVITGLGFMALGAANQAPGALPVGTVYVLWPLVYMFLVAGASKPQVIKALTKALVFATIAIGIYSLAFLLNFKGILPDVLYVELEQGQVAGIGLGTVKFNLYSVASLFFLVPFVVSALVAWPKNKNTPVRRCWLWLALFLGLFAAALSGRRALELVIAVAPFVVLVWRRICDPHRSISTWRALLAVLSVSIIGGTCVFLLAEPIFGLRIHAVVLDIIEGLNARSADPRVYERSQQFYALLDGWLRSPIVGAGHGAFVPAVVRSYEQPWAYELSYMGLLYHTGILGLSIYAAGVIWIFANGIKVGRSGDTLSLYMQPVLVGTISFLIGNASNPYLEKFDCMWVIFLPVALINAWLLMPKKGMAGPNAVTANIDSHFVRQVRHVMPPLKR